ncbi:hypothetical protein [Agilicoccus flavus]|uniref:hypothetical protein n=1 Tax=Agilicoccus flavus TaxID=2775968 RepID=UPI001CF6FBC4|nr:hypothetical protein [Agilicoccus flavus]
MFDAYGNPSGEQLDCIACGQTYERPDVTADPEGRGAVCSLCLTTDRTGLLVLPAQQAAPRPAEAH